MAGFYFKKWQRFALRNGDIAISNLKDLRFINRDDFSHVFTAPRKSLEF